MVMMQRRSPSPADSNDHNHGNDHSGTTASSAVEKRSHPPSSKLPGQSSTSSSSSLLSSPPLRSSLSPSPSSSPVIAHLSKSGRFSGEPTFVLISDCRVFSFRQQRAAVVFPCDCLEAGDGNNRRQYYLITITTVGSYV